MVFEPMAIKEVGHGGILVDTRFPMQLNSLHAVRLTLGEQSIVVKGRVAHCRISDVDQDIVTYRSGLEFIELSERTEAVILEFLEAIRTSRRPV